MPALATLSPSKPDVAEIIAAALSQPDDALDYAELKLAFDALVEPFDIDAAREEIDRLTAAARALAEGPDDEMRILSAICTCLYRPGPWNDHRPFAYDRSDPKGQQPYNARLPNYLDRRLGNCIAMPVLLLILCDRLGLNVALASAPLHVFVRLTLGDGRVLNLEATSGGHPARDAWYREGMPMSDRAIESGMYLRTLSRRASVALMACTVADNLFRAGRYTELLAVTDVLLRHNRRDGQLLMKRANAYAGMIESEFERVYPMPFLIPAHLRPRYLWLEGCYHSLVNAAEALGWEWVEP